jgi:hypothetical protein
LGEFPVHIWARFLRQKPFELVADLLKLRIFVDVNQTIPTETILRLLRHHGYRVTLEDP